MCGRFGAPYRDITTAWKLHGNFSFQTRYNIVPSQEVPVIIRNEGRNEAKLMKWGLVPSWAPDPSMGQRMINARSETLLEKPSRPNLGAEWTRHFNVTRIEVERVGVHRRAPFSVHPGLDPVLVKEAHLSNAPDVAHADILHAVAFVKLSAPTESRYQCKRRP